MGLLDWLLPGKPLPETVEKGIACLIQTVDPRLKALSRAPEVLAPLVEQALDFCHRTVAELPGPLDASPEHWRESAQLRALFTSTHDLQLVFSRQMLIQDYAASHPETREFHAILGAVLQEKKGFGVALNGEALQHDVAITTLNFTRHQLYYPTPDSATLDHTLAWALFEQFAQEILQRLSTLRNGQEELQEEIALLRTHLAHVAHTGLSQVFCNGEAADAGELCATRAERLSQRLKIRERELADARRRLLTLDDTLEWIADTLSRPEELVEVDTLAYCIDSVNRLVAPPETGTSLSFSHFRFTAPHPRQGVILRVRYPRDQLLPARLLQQEIERLYG